MINVSFVASCVCVRVCVWPNTVSEYYRSKEIIIIKMSCPEGYRERRKQFSGMRKNYILCIEDTIIHFLLSKSGSCRTCYIKLNFVWNWLLSTCWKFLSIQHVIWCSFCRCIMNNLAAINLFYQLKQIILNYLYRSSPNLFIPETRHRIIYILNSWMKIQTYKDFAKSKIFME